MGFQKATKKQSRLRLALIGPSGSGKTFSALRIATGFGGRIGVLDTERGSASKYADRFAFDVMELETFHPERYVEAIREAERAGVEVLIVDSLSHAWSGKDGALEQVDNAAKRQKGNSFGAWREVTPMHNALVDAILRSKCHIIATMRAKTEYVVEQGPGGKSTPRKVGLAPVQRDGMEYEFDVVGDMDNSSLVVTKTRCPDLAEAVLPKPGEDLGMRLRGWLTDGAPPAGRAINHEPPPPSDNDAPPPADSAESRWAKRDGEEPIADVMVGFKTFKSRKMSTLSLEELGQAWAEGMDLLEEDAKARRKMENEGLPATEQRWVGNLKKKLGLIERWRAKKETVGVNVEAAP